VLYVGEIGACWYKKQVGKFPFAFMTKETTEKLS